MMKVTIIRATGAEETHEVPRGSIGAVRALLGCEFLDTVNLGDGRVMLVDDEGWNTEVIQTAERIEVRPTTPRKPINDRATAIYRSVTLPNHHRIAGDVAIVRDEDFA
jgi:hypothetical protein